MTYTSVLVSERVQPSQVKSLPAISGLVITQILFAGRVIWRKRRTLACRLWRCRMAGQRLARESPSDGILVA